MRFLILMAIAGIILASCSYSDVEKNRKIEAFHVPEYQSSQAQKPKLDRAGELIRTGSGYYHSAIAETDPMKKKALLKSAAKYYEQAVDELKALQARSKSQRDKEELGLVIKSVQEDLFDCYRLMPITGE